MNIKKFNSDYYNEGYFCQRGFRGRYESSDFALDNKFHKEIANLIVDVLEVKNSKLLEIGCAFGNVIFHLKDKVDSYGVDISEYAVKNSYLPGKVKQADIIDGIPFADEFFDYVFSRETLEHIDETYIPNVVKEIYRVMKKGGRGLISTANNFFDKETKKQEDDVNRDESHLCVKPPYWWAEKFEEGGFKIDWEKTLSAMCLPLPQKWCWTMLKIVKV